MFSRRVATAGSAPPGCAQQPVCRHPALVSKDGGDVRLESRGWTASGRNPGSRYRGKHVSPDHKLEPCVDLRAWMCVFRHPLVVWPLDRISERVPAVVCSG